MLVLLPKIVTTLQPPFSMKRFSLTVLSLLKWRYTHFIKNRDLHTTPFNINIGHLRHRIQVGNHLIFILIYYFLLKKLLKFIDSPST